MKVLPLQPVFDKSKPTMMDFSDWHVPAFFTSILDEHSAVREKAGFFDISHMGYFTVKGSGAESFLDHVCTNDISGMNDFQARYSLLCNSEGGIIDDVFVYKRSSSDFFLIVNASNIEKDYKHMQANSSAYDIEFQNESEAVAIFAVQGPIAPDVISSAFDVPFSDMSFHTFADVEYEGTSFIVSTTGYTGEAGGEMILPLEKAEYFYERLKSAGADNLQLIGFGARDTLRLEATCHLYGNDMDETTSPFEVGLGWIVKMEKDDFIGKASLLKLKETVDRKLVCFEVTGRGIARHGYEVYVGEGKIGEVTSGSFCPTVKKNVGLALIDKKFSEVGTDIDIAVRKRRVTARVVKRPFYKREK